MCDTQEDLKKRMAETLRETAEGLIIDINEMLEHGYPLNMEQRIDELMIIAKAVDVIA